MTEPIRCRTATDLTRHLAALCQQQGLTQQDVIAVLEDPWQDDCDSPDLDGALRRAAALGYDLALIPRPPYLVDAPLPDEDVTP